jgi:hypothetical protein
MVGQGPYASGGTGNVIGARPGDEIVIHGTTIGPHHDVTISPP